MWSSIFNAVSRIFNFISEFVNVAEKGLSVANVHVDNYHKETVACCESRTQLNIATHNRRIQEELEADAKLAKLYADIAKEW